MSGEPMKNHRRGEFNIVATAGAREKNLKEGIGERMYERPYEKKNGLSVERRGSE